MNVKQAIRASFDLSSMVVSSYLGDLTDEEFFVRPGTGCNHAAWQMGHLIASEGHLLQSIVDCEIDTLPEGFAETHGKENAASEDQAGFLSKAEYLELFNKVRGKTLEILDSVDESLLDEPSPENLASFAPTKGSVFLLIANHPMMHAGQFVVVRRLTGKPIVM